MSQSEAQRRAKQKYDAKTYKPITCKCKLPEYDMFQSYAQQQNISSMNKLISKAIMYCINHNINLTDESIETNNTSKQLFDLRTQHNLTPTQVAEQLEVPYQEYIKYESGSNNPKLDILLKACKLYNVPQSYFGINSDLVAVGNKGYVIENHDGYETFIVTTEEFVAVKKFIERLRNKGENS